MDYFEALLNYLFQKEMKKDPKANRIMIIESHPGSAGLLKQREALCQLMFEKFQVPSLMIRKGGELAMLS